MTVALSNAVTKCIKKEDSLRRLHLDKQLAQVEAENPEWLEVKVPVSKRQHIEDRLQTLRAERAELLASLTPEQAEQQIVTDLSKSMWRRANPTFTTSNTHRLMSVTKQEFQWRADEIEPMDKTNNRRRDEQTDYMNAEVIYNQMMK